MFKTYAPVDVMEKYKQIDCFRNNFKFWKFLAISPFHISWRFYPCYSILFVTAFIVIFNALSTLNIYFLPRCIDVFVDEMMCYFTDLAVMSKVFTFIFMRDKIKRMFEILESEMFQPESDEARKIIDDAKKFNVRYWKIVMIFSVMANLFYMTSPLVAHLFLKVELILPVSTYSFIPEHIKETFIYPLYFYQIFSIHFNMQYNVNIDSFFLGLMIFVIAQLKIIEGKLTKVTDIKKDIASVSEKRDIKASERQIILKLNKALIHYDEVARFCSLIEEVFSVTLFVQFSMASCIICICLVKFTMPASWQYYVFLAAYMFVMIIQILVPCWYGTRIMDQSCLLSQAIYSCNWTATSKRFKSSMKLFVERTNRPLSIVGWKMFPLSLVTFTSIMNTAYSFFTLLRNMQSR